jgi:hypothetical protein
VFVKADGSAGGVRFADLLRRANLRLVTAIGRSEATFGDRKPKFSTHSFGCHFVAAAVTDAVHHATGVRVRELPIKIEDLLG